MISHSISGPLSDDALQGAIGTRSIINSKFDAVRISEIKFGKVAVAFATVLIYALHAALEDAVIAFNGIRVDIAAHIFIGLVANALMTRKVSAKRELVATFVGHYRGFLGDVGLDDWHISAALVPST